MLVVNKVLWPLMVMLLALQPHFKSKDKHDGSCSSFLKASFNDNPALIFLQKLFQCIQSCKVLRRVYPGLSEEISLFYLLISR